MDPEKAYAQVRGGYLNIANGNSGEAAAMLTGGRSAEYRVVSMTPAQIARIIDEALTNRWPAGFLLGRLGFPGRRQPTPP